MTEDRAVDAIPTESSMRVDLYEAIEEYRYGVWADRDVNVHDMEDLVFCRWRVCLPGDVLESRIGIYLDSCPESVDSCGHDMESGGGQNDGGSG